ncbi:uncharacterized protein LOC111632996 [Centruroides sculpturatus]|uniref:uncharacterized protein LOC111632996 n=1 Tax=Centruroides sculpturatus TaxID=218467 RepID=UPI000C6E017E|nr:uncharacterized protein LOC111632996 [Centruroides sculpturatus]
MASSGTWVRSSNTKSQDCRNSQNMNELFASVRRIDVQKTKFKNSYRLWDVKSGKAVKKLKDIEKSINNNTDIANCVKIGGDIGKIVGSIALITSAFIDDKKASKDWKNVGTDLTTFGMVFSEGSTAMNSFLTENLCKEAKETMDELFKCTEELEKESKEYFRLVNICKNLLKTIDEEEIQLIRDYLDKDKYSSFRSDDFWNSHLPPTLPKMENLRLNENSLNDKHSKRDLISIIAQYITENPVLKEFFDWKLEDLPFVNGRNIIDGVLGTGNITFSSSAFEFMKPFCSGMSNRTALGLSGAFFLANEILGMVDTCSKFQNGSVQSREVRRVIGKLEKYRDEVRSNLSATLGWDSFKKDWYSWEEKNALIFENPKKNSNYNHSRYKTN